MCLLAACDRGSGAPPSSPNQLAPEVLDASHTWLLPDVVSVVDVTTSADPADSILWLLTVDSSPLIRFDARAGTVTRFGRRGRGPTDILFPWNFSSGGARDTSPLLFDVGDMKLVRYLPSGDVVTRSVTPTIGRSSITTDFRAMFNGHPKKLLTLEDRWVWTEPGPNAHSDRHLWPIALVSAKPGSVGVDTLLWRDMARELTANSRLQALIPVPLLARCNDEEAVLYLGEPDSVVWIHAGNGARHAVAAMLPRHAMNDATRRHYLEQRITRESQESGRSIPDVGEMAKMLSAIDDKFRAFVPDSTPRAVELACDVDGGVAITVFPFLAAEKRVPDTIAVLLVSRDGTAEWRSLPAGQRVMSKTRQGLWTISDDEPEGIRLSYFNTG